MRKILKATIAAFLAVAAVAGAYQVAGTMSSPVVYGDQAREGANASRALRPTPLGKKENEDESKQIEARDKWFYGRRAFPEKHVGYDKMKRAQRQARAIGRDIAPEDGGSEADAGRAAPTASLAWTSIGPQPIADGTPSEYNGTAPWAGRVTSIAHHPTTSSIAYVGGATGGVWKTTDDGVTWKAIFDSQPSLAVGTVAVDPNNANNVFVGTGEANFGADSYFGAGIFKSTNAGTSWSKIGGTTFDNCNIADIVVKPGSSATIFVAAHPYGRYTGSCASGIFRSTDGGATWTMVDFGGAPTDLAFKPGTPSTIYAGWYQYGVWRSTQNGDSGSWASTGIGYSETGRTAISVTKANPERIYATEMNATQEGYGSTLATFSSTNSGDSWSQLPWTNYCGYSNSELSGQCSYDIAIAADPVSQTTVYAAGVRLMRFAPSTWTLIGYGTSGLHVDVHSLTFDAANRLWVGSDGGVWRKSTTGNTFTNLNRGLSLTQFTAGTSGSVSRTLVGGTQDNGTLYRKAASPSWYEFSTGDGGYSAVDPANANTIYSSYIYGTLSKSTDGGTNNTCVFTSSANYSSFCAFTAPDSTQFYTPIEMSPASAQTLYVGTTRVWRTTTGGTSWTAGSPHFPGTITALGAAKTAVGTVYAAWQSSTGTGVKKSTSATSGGTWTDTGTLPTRVISHIEVDPATSNTAYVGLSGFGGGHVYRTTNGGTSWTNISGNLPDSPVNAIAIDKRTTPNTLYAGTDVGVFWSIDGGVTWANAKQGLPNAVVTDVRVDTVANRLIASTYGRGMYTVPIPTPSIRTFTPTSGVTGSTVTISGSGFTGVKSVKFGTKTATYTVGSSTSITATVPNGAVTGKISVTTGAGTAVSLTNYTVTGSITSFSPTSGPAGTSVVIRGTGFTGATAVKFNGVTATSRTVNSSTQITATVPSTATTGRITVTTSAGKILTSATSFTKT